MKTNCTSLFPAGKEIVKVQFSDDEFYSKRNIIPVDLLLSIFITPYALYMHLKIYIHFYVI